MTAEQHTHDFTARKVSGSMIGTRAQTFRACSCGLSEPMFQHLLAECLDMDETASLLNPRRAASRTTK